MKVIKADHNRRVEIPGVPDPVPRPVDIDKLQTGFASLRSLRIYRFDANSVINGHAEEDEVLIVVLAGTVELAMTESNSADHGDTFALLGAGEMGTSKAEGNPCAAYLPPHAAYRLTSRSDAEVAYARATPASGRSPTVFSSFVGSDRAGVAVLFEEATYAQRLRMRMLHISATQAEIDFTPKEKSEDLYEALVNVRTIGQGLSTTITSAHEQPTLLESWDTVALMPGERPTLRVSMGSSLLALVVLAT